MNDDHLTPRGSVRQANFCDTVDLMGRVLFIKKYLILSHFIRNISSEILTNELNNDIRKKIEEYWGKRLSPKNGHDHFYAASVLCPTSVMHLPNMRLLAIKDSITRYRQMNDCQVQQTEYWNFPQTLEETHCESFSQLKKLVLDTKKQLREFCLTAEDCKISCMSADFCLRSQHLFLKLFNAGLIYQRKTLVNDGSKCKKLPNDCAEARRETKYVSKRWFLRTSRFAHDLYHHLCLKKGLPKNDIVHLHKLWIGDCNGFSFDCSTDVGETLNLWVPNAEFMSHAELVVIKPNSLYDVLYGGSKDSEGKLKMNVINPATSEKLPVYVNEDVEYPLGKDEYLGAPAVCENDRKFAENVGLKSCAISGKSHLETVRFELNRVSSQLNDWPVSQTEAEGVLVPLIYCHACGFQPVPELELPVIVPSLPKNLKNKDLQGFLETTAWTRNICPNCGVEAEREKSFIDPVFLSCISTYRYGKGNRLIPADLIVWGGDEAVYQSYFTRFLSYILNSLDLCLTAEPSMKLLCCNSFLNQFTSDTFQRNCLEFDKIFKKASAPTLKESDMSGTIVHDIRNKYGCDVTRLFLVFASESPHFLLDQNEQTEMLTWQNNLWMTVQEFLRIRERPLAFISPWINVVDENKKLRNDRNECVHQVMLDYSETLDLKSCINAMRKWTNKLRRYPREARKLSVEFERSLSALIIMLTPVMPHFAATLWMAFTSAEGRLAANSEEIEWNENVVLQKWPKIDEDFETPVILRINSHFILTGGSILCNEINELTLEKTLEIAKKSRDVRKFFRRNRILDIHLNTVRNLQAELIITSEKDTSTQQINVVENYVKKEN